jgi:uncharacterized protein YndB with AHSA1/START domain
MYSIKHLFHINAPADKVYKAISTIKGLSGWWTVETLGTSEPEQVIQFRFGNQGPDMKVIQFNTDQKVVWECVASPFGWEGNSITFLLDQNQGKTRVRFTHEGFKEQDDFYAICNFSWGRYMESLRQYCQTGKGEAFGSQYYRQ